MICGFVENHGNRMILSLQIIAMLTWKEMTCVENQKIAYCVNCCNTNITGYCWQRSFFCDFYCNTGHFLCSVERIKHFVNVHLHCIVSNIPSKVHKYSGPPELCTVKSHSHALATFQSNGNSTENKKLFEWNVSFVRILIRLYTYYKTHKVCN